MASGSLGTAYTQSRALTLHTIKYNVLCCACKLSFENVLLTVPQAHLRTVVPQVEHSM